MWKEKAEKHRPGYSGLKTFFSTRTPPDYPELVSISQYAKLSSARVCGDESGCAWLSTPQRGVPQAPGDEAHRRNTCRVEFVNICAPAVRA